MVLAISLGTVRPVLQRHNLPLPSISSCAYVLLFADIFCYDLKKTAQVVILTWEREKSSEKFADKELQALASSTRTRGLIDFDVESRINSFDALEKIQKVEKWVPQKK